MRRKDKAVIALADLEAIILSSPYVTLGLNDNGETYLVPLDFGYESGQEKPGALYFHCAVAGRKLDIIKRRPRVSLLFVSEHKLIDEGDGSLACTLNTAYRSVMASGLARIIEDDAEKEAAIHSVLKRYGCESRPVAPDKLAKTALVRVDINEAVGKAYQKSQA